MIGVCRVGVGFFWIWIGIGSGAGAGSVGVGEMDPSTLINEGAFSNANAASYNLAEIWPFPMSGGGVGVGDLGGGLGLRRPQFAQNLARLGDVSAANRDVSGNDPMRLDQRGSGGARKRRDAAGDESPKGPSTSNGIGIGNGNGNGNGVAVFSVSFNRIHLLL